MATVSTDRPGEMGMAIELNSPSFWDGNAELRREPSAFTAAYAERAWQLAALPPGARVLDIACGAGALALVAAQAGAQVLATDFSPGMVRAVRAHDVPNLDACVMDGQALDLPDATFDAAFSLFGIMLFPDWRKGLAEMARVLRPGGTGSVSTWKDESGAAANNLLACQVATLFPDVQIPTPVTGMNEFRVPDRFRAAMTDAGFADVSIAEMTQDFIVEAAALDQPDRLFQFSPLWPQLAGEQRERVLASIRTALSARGGTLAVPCPALIATARRA